MGYYSIVFRPYMEELLVRYRPTRPLRSADKGLLVQTKYNLKTYDYRAFSRAASKIWNSLPVSICACCELGASKSKACFSAVILFYFHYFIYLVIHYYLYLYFLFLINKSYFIRFITISTNCKALWITKRKALYKCIYYYYIIILIFRLYRT